jgi:hypothetical protein
MWGTVIYHDNVPSPGRSSESVHKSIASLPSAGRSEYMGKPMQATSSKLQGFLKIKVALQLFDSVVVCTGLRCNL